MITQSTLKNLGFADTVLAENFNLVYNIDGAMVFSNSRNFNIADTLRGFFAPKVSANA